ncbi:MAG: FAD-binding oxidoreductase [Bacillota bacterium]|nr:FAD-binding oxidoreductase [Bacillota bacterium]
MERLSLDQQPERPGERPRAAAGAVAPSPPRRILASSEEEVARALAEASAQGLAVLPQGGGSQWGLGEPPRAGDLLLSLAGLRGVVEYAPEELVVRVRAGTPLDELNDFLAPHGQWFPVEPVAAPGATVGGLLATGASGARRLAFGTPRDVTTGVRFVLPDGRVMHNGSRVVKNVAGYDVMRLLIGSLGTLAVLTEAWLRVRPLPARRETLLVGVRDPAEALDLGRRRIASELLPTALELLDPRAAARLGLPARTTLAVALEGDAPEVAYQRERIALLAGGPGGAAPGGFALERLEDGASDAFWRAFHRRLPAGATLVVRASATLADLPALLLAAAESGLEAALVAGPGHGVLRLFAAPAEEEEALARWSGFLRRWREAAEALGGAVVVEKAPDGLRGRFPAWGTPPPAIELMRAVKARFDPRGVLNPGRFVGGI